MNMKVVTKKAEKATQMNLKAIPRKGFNFYDVIDNVEKLIDYEFPNDGDLIRKTVNELYIKYYSKIDHCYENFMDLANDTNSFKKWYKLSYKLTEKLDERAGFLLDLYFQYTMVENSDINSDLLIHAWFEDVEPFYTFKS